jgi:hypothetical protein
MRRVIQESNDITARMTEQTQSAAGTATARAAACRYLRCVLATRAARLSPSLCLQAASHSVWRRRLRQSAH